MSGFSANQIVLSGKTRQFVTIPFACMWMSHFSANRIAFGRKTRHSHSTQLLVDESINATVRLGGEVGRGDNNGFFPKCRLFPRTKLYIAEEPDILK